MTNNNQEKQLKSSFNYEDLISCARGEMFGPGNAQLPLPPMLMFDRITQISDKGGTFDKGYARAELDITPNLWFFDCHFKDDPVMPGCLGLDAVWQLIGFYLGWLGEKGKGRAISVGKVRFANQITPQTKTLEFGADFTRIMRSKLTMAIADGWVKADNKTIYQMKDVSVGLFIN